MIRSILSGSLLLGLAACGGADSGQAGNGADATTQAAATASPELAAQNLAFWADRWWNTANADESKGAFVDMVPTDFKNEQFKVVFKRDVNDSSPREADAPAAPSATRLEFVLGGEKKSFTMVTGAESGVAARANRRRCIILSPDKTVYCGTTEVRQ